MSKSIYLGKTAINPSAENIKFEEVIRNKESFYLIENSDAMRPFFMSIVVIRTIGCLSQATERLQQEGK